MSLEYRFTIVRIETCDNCKWTVTEKSMVDCIRHAKDIIEIESKRTLRSMWTSIKCEVCEGVKHES